MKLLAKIGWSVSVWTENAPGVAEAEQKLITSKLTSKAQTTIPQAVRRHLGLKPGDLIGFVIEGERIVLTRPLAAAAQRAALPVFAEWESDADQRSYDRL
jgi:antitoxin PrlF